MSATGRNIPGHERHPDDLYATPAWVTRAILPHVHLGPRVLDPCAGDGAILRVLQAAGLGMEHVAGLEFDGARAKACREAGFSCIETDALRRPWDRPSGVIMNPPFKLAMEFVEKALAEVRLGEVVVLLRLAFLESRARAAFHRKHPSDVFVLAQRPSFAHGKTDSAAYGWFRWNTAAPRPGRIVVLPDGPTDEERAAARGARATAVTLPEVNP